MILIETRSCLKKLEAAKIERGYIEQFKASLNSRRPTRSRDENLEHDRAYALDDSPAYYQQHKVGIIAQKKQYYERNKDRVQARQSEMYQCGCGATLTRGAKYGHLKSQRHQQWASRQEPEVEPSEINA